MARDARALLCRGREEHDEHAGDTIARPAAVAIAMCSPSATLASAASAPSIAVTGATTEIAPRSIAAYENVRPAITPMPPKTIQAIEPPDGCDGAPSQTAIGSTMTKPNTCTQASAESAPITRVERLSKAAADPPRRRRAQRGHDHEHQEMVPVVARRARWCRG